MNTQRRSVKALELFVFINYFEVPFPLNYTKLRTMAVYRFSESQDEDTEGRIRERASEREESLISSSISYRLS